MTTISIEIPDVLAAQLAEVAKSRDLALNDFMLLAATEKWARYEEEDIKQRASSPAPAESSGNGAQFGNESMPFHRIPRVR